MGCAYGIMGESDESTDEGAQGITCEVCNDTSTSTATRWTGGSVGGGGTGAGGTGAGGTGAGGTGAGGTGGGSTCDQSGDCMTCANCSLSGMCAGTANTCMADAECSDLLDCLSACYDDVCANECFNRFPNGTTLYMAMTECAFCDACPVDCQYESQGLCY